MLLVNNYTMCYYFLLENDFESRNARLEFFTFR